MTWFRCGGGGSGIPAALKNRMNAVLNKKFGTAVDYPAEGWPDDVNLLGLLEEKTQASASVCSFEDGADDVPTKSIVVTIPPTLSGVSALIEKQIPSRNMASMSDADFTLNNVQYSTENGVLHINGTSTGETSSGNNAFKALDFWLPSGTYYFSRGATLTSLNVATYLRKYDDKTEIKANQGAFTLSENTHLYISFYIYNKTFSNIKAEICINIGSTSITYEDTAPITQYTASLGRTIYGGQADIVNGTGTDENGNDFTFDGQEIPTKLGYNAFWSDEGDTEVTYRGQGTITPVLPTLISKTITENGTYNASDDSADGYSSVTVNVSGGSCERLLYLHCVNNDQIEIPAASSITQGAKYSQYVSYDSTTKKFTVLQDFTAIIIAWVYTYQTYESSRSDGALYINNSQIIQYEANGTAAGSTGGVYLARNFKQNDTFNIYTPTRDGYPQQNLKIYLLADVPDSIYTFTDENA